MTDQPRQPVFNIPGTVLALVVLLAAIQLGQDWASDDVQASVLKLFAFVPGRWAAAFDPAAVASRLASIAQGEGIDAAQAGRYFLGTGALQPWTPLTYSLLHGGWSHLGLNALWLLAFGTPVARRLRAWRFALLYIVGALAGAAAHFAVDPLSLQPLVGASAAVSAFMGAALRFVFQATRPARDENRPETAPRLPLSALVKDRRIAAFAVVWFVSNLVTGIAAVPLGLSDMPIAWQAHVGGFLCGLLLFPLFDPVPRDGTEPVEPFKADGTDESTAV